MRNQTIFPSSVKGTIKVPSSKSQTLRAFLWASLAEGKSTIYDPLDSLDTETMKRAICSYGATIKGNHPIEIEGIAGKPFFHFPSIDAQNSGIVARFLTPLAALTSTPIFFTGDESLQLRRPIAPLLEALQKKGAKVRYTQKKGHFPFWIQGPFIPEKIEVEGKDSQIVSALLITASILDKPFEILVKNPGETPWVNMTLDWLQKRGIRYEQKDYTYYRVEGKKISAFSYQVPGDFSSALFMVAAALVSGEVTLENLDLNDPQGDKIVFSWLAQIGGSFSWKQKQLTVRKSILEGGTFAGNLAIDALPMLAVLGCFSQKGIRIENCEMARFKESNRIEAIASELRKMGATIVTGKDFLHSFPSKLKGAKVYSFQDHRIAMALSIAALQAEGKTTIEGVDCVAKTYPCFFSDLEKLGAYLGGE